MERIETIYNLYQVVKTLCRPSSHDFMLHGFSADDFAELDESWKVKKNGTGPSYYLTAEKEGVCLFSNTIQREVKEVHLSLAEVAEKFDLPVESLRIKD